MKLELRGVSCRAGGFELAVSATLSGPITGVFGPSGAGKTTLLEIIAGLRRPDTGAVSLGEVVFEDRPRGTFVAPEVRRIGYVPQDGALFPHLSVEQNLRYGWRTNATPLDQLCELFDLQPLRARPIAGLSGGERQRVAIVRALATAPRLLLLDEPLAGVDVIRKDTILPYLRRLREELRIPMLYVSHALPEIVMLCDELVVLDQGRVLQSGPLESVLSRPSHAEVARLVGFESVVRGRIDSVTDDLAVVSLGGARLAALVTEFARVGAEVLVCIRAEDVILLNTQTSAPVATSARNRLSSVVRAITPVGTTRRIELDCGFPLVAMLTRQAVADLALAPGRAVDALIKAPHVHLMPVR